MRTRNPVYVMERMLVPQSLIKENDVEEKGDDDSCSSNGSGGKHPRRPHFFEEPRLPEAFRSRNGSYHLSGYDRGHLAAAANYTSALVPYGYLKDTYNLCNVSPQHPRFNATVWARLEDWVRRVAATMHHTDPDFETWVVTGPLWLPERVVPEIEAPAGAPFGKLLEYRYKALGPPPNVVPVPTHFFKVVAVVFRSGIARHACFVVPNRQPDDDWSLEDGLVRWTDLEVAAGLEFFPSLADAAWKMKADKATDYPRPMPLLLPSGDDESSLLPSTVVSQGRGNRRRGRPPLFGSSSTSPAHLCPNGSCPKYPYPRMIEAGRR